MTCPFAPNRESDMYCNGRGKNAKSLTNGSQNEMEMTYGNYLQVERLLSCVKPVAEIYGPEAVHDEHLFIITHQAYELWFKQIIFELRSVKELFSEEVIDERQMLRITSRLNRVVVILKLLVEQIIILETMAPLDFMEFRKYLSPASGFQSVQFRLIENMLGVRKEHRVNYSKDKYISVFTDPKIVETIQQSEDDISLCDLVQRWLERTPGLEPNGFNFWKKYQDSVQVILDGLEQEINEEDDEEIQKVLEKEYLQKKKTFDSLFDVTIYNSYVAKGERTFSHKAIQGALMISLYRDEPRFNQPFHILTQLMDIDSFLTKWRYNHVLMVQRMLGSSTVGTGGSCGYWYLKSTLGDRYKVFRDLCNLSMFLLPSCYVPPLTERMKRCLSIGSDEDDYDRNPMR